MSKLKQWLRDDMKPKTKAAKPKPEKQEQAKETPQTKDGES